MCTVNATLNYFSSVTSITSLWVICYVLQNSCLKWIHDFKIKLVTYVHCSVCLLTFSFWSSYNHILHIAKIFSESFIEVDLHSMLSFFGQITTIITRNFLFLIDMIYSFNTLFILKFTLLTFEYVCLRMKYLWSLFWWLSMQFLMKVPIFAIWAHLSQFLIDIRYICSIIRSGKIPCWIFRILLNHANAWIFVKINLNFFNSNICYDFYLFHIN